MRGLDFRLGSIVLTDDSCVIRGNSWPNIPTLIWSDGIDETASDWFRALVVEYGVQPSSAKEYAKTLRPFLRFCRRRRRGVFTVDDAFLVVWREHLRRASGLSDQRINTSLRVAFAFFRWAEESRRTRYQVGIYTADEIPTALAGIPFPISAKRSFYKGPYQRVFGNWTTPLVLTVRSEDKQPRHTPTEKQIRDLHEAAVDRQQGERDSLMLSWAEESGLRRAEFLSVGKSQLPSAENLSELIEKDEPWFVTVKRKGGTCKPVSIQPDLIIRTLDFIQYERQEIVDKSYQTINGYREPDEIFLSSKTGKRLHQDSVTSIGGRIFKKAKVARASIHRLRARFAVRTIETLVDALFNGDMVGPESSWIETIILKASEMMGQASPQSLRPYLTYVLNRRIRNSDADKASRLEARLRQMRLYEGTLVRRLHDYTDLQRAAENLRAGLVTEAVSILRGLTDRLTSIAA